MFTPAGEVFGGIELSSYDNDTQVLFKSLEKANTLVPHVLSMIKGPWALIYWQVTFCIFSPYFLVSFYKTSSLSGKLKNDVVW